MESPPSFFENSTLALDFLTKSSQTAAPSLLQTSQKNSDASSDMKSPYPQHTTLKPTEKQSDSTRKSKPTSTSSAVPTLKHGLTISLWLSSSTTTVLTPPPANLHSTSCLDMNHKLFPTSLKPPTFRCWKNASEPSTHHEKKHLLHTNLHSVTVQLGGSWDPWTQTWGGNRRWRGVSSLPKWN